MCIWRRVKNGLGVTMQVESGINPTVLTFKMCNSQIPLGDTCFRFGLCDFKKYGIFSKT